MMEVNKEEIRAEVHEKGRLDAFSDGVLAIAITLLVLEIRLPAGEHEGGLLQLLLEEWPSYFAYLVSFLTIGIMWINHDSLFAMFRRVDRTVLMLNVLLLLAITFLNFPTVILAEYIQTDQMQVAALFYSLTTLIIAVCYNALWWYARAHSHLLHEALVPELQRALTRSYNIGLGLYTVAFLAGFVNGVVSIALCFGLAVFFALPLRGGNILPR
jgi:uncharacterized membrane protein